MMSLKVRTEIGFMHIGNITRLLMSCNSEMTLGLIDKRTVLSCMQRIATYLRASNTPLTRSSRFARVTLKNAVKMH